MLACIPSRISDRCREVGRGESDRSIRCGHVSLQLGSFTVVRCGFNYTHIIYHLSFPLVLLHFILMDLPVYIPFSIHSSVSVCRQVLQKWMIFFFVIVTASYFVFHHCLCIYHFPLTVHCPCCTSTICTPTCFCSHIRSALSNIIIVCCALRWC